MNRLCNLYKTEFAVGFKKTEQLLATG